MDTTKCTARESVRSTDGLTWLAGVIAQGPQTVRSLILSGDEDRALGMATWLHQMGHPQAEALIDEARRAIHETLRAVH